MSSPISSTQPAQQLPQGEQAPTLTVQRIRAKDWSGEHKGIDPLDDDNWQAWRDDIDLAFNVCGLRGYVNGEISCPDAGSDPVSADNWLYNDDYTKKVIHDRVSRGQKHHLTNCTTAHEMWSNLKATHQVCGDQTENQLMRELTDTKANEGDDIIQHLAKIKRLWDRITLVSPDDLPLTPKLFKKFLAYSLPPTWDEFTRQFFRDPEKKNLTVPKFIGKCHEEYRQRLIRGNENGQMAYAAMNKPLAKRLGNATQKPNQGKKRARCTHCGHNNHSVENCYHIKKPKCSGCHKLGHEIDDCRSKKKSQSSTSRYNKDKKVADALAPVKQANIAEMDEDDDEETLTAIEAENFTVTDDSLEDDMYLTSLAANESSRMYDWLADSGSTHHITNHREIYDSYEPTPDATVHGVGGKIISVLGRGTVKLVAQYGTRKRVLRLDNMSYIPTNKYNIFALGRWNSQGWTYKATDGELILLDRQNIPILKGTNIASHIYKFRLPPADASHLRNEKQFIFSCDEPKQSWEVWHKRFGHVSYNRLRRLHLKGLVTGFEVDVTTPTLDCIACTEAKQSRKPYAKQTETRSQNKGELTHMDLWGKYDILSIAGHQYYLLLIDDATRYTTLYFLKGKHEAARCIKEYMTHMHIRGTPTHAIRVDCGSEFVNKDLQDWCHSKGMEVQMTAPYSPSQNGVAERMNRTLVELARAMLTGSQLPEFLWEQAVAHAAYIRNRSYTIANRDRTPYEAWHGNKPNVTHLREFGTPVWVLLQGQNVTRKILPKSKRRAYVGTNDASDSVLYYNAETKKILTSRNYKFLTEQKEAAEEIAVSPTREGEYEDNARGINT